MTALQQLGLDESSLLNEIEHILGVGSLSKSSSAKPSISPPKGFSFKEYSKPSSITTIHKHEPESYSQASHNITKSNWMRTASGGYVKEPSQENVTENFIGGKHNQTPAKSSASPQPPKRPAPPTDDKLTQKQFKSPLHIQTVITSQESKTISSEPVGSVTKFSSKPGDLNQSNQFSAQYTPLSQQQPCVPQRSSALTKTIYNTNVGSTTSLTLITDGQQTRSREGSLVAGHAVVNASPVGFSSTFKGTRLCTLCIVPGLLTVRSIVYCVKN